MAREAFDLIAIEIQDVYAAALSAQGFRGLGFRGFRG